MTPSPHPRKPLLLRPLAKAVKRKQDAVVHDVLALDFETANQNRAACSLGVVRMVNDEEIYREHFLIDPEDSFEDTSIWVHGITPQQVWRAPHFPQVIEEVFRNISPTTMLLAHNAKFDMNVLHKGLGRYEVRAKSVPFLCSVKLGEAFFSDVPSCNLAALSQKLSYDLQHHDALSDAIGSLTVLKHMGERLKLQGESLEAFTHRKGIRHGMVGSRELTHVKSAAGKLYVLPQAMGHHQQSLAGTSFCFAGDLTYWNKKQAEKLVTDRGAVLKNRMSRQVDYFVIGNRGFFSSPEAWELRQDKAKAFAAASSMKVLTESEFVAMMKRQLAREANSLGLLTP